MNQHTPLRNCGNGYYSNVYLATHSPPIEGALFERMAFNKQTRSSPSKVTSNPKPEFCCEDLPEMQVPWPFWALFRKT